ncbi:hypothetical protein AYI69_g11503 [Smittium culicis]|uniref:Uncharacterized protein n=1 Tax=Smittium culicis TaxID=133412 RepID=A0A1R1WY27_9FUNG|nr:hypothetical protein AYI69_g11503 [Smittium culicis]
MNPFTIEDPVSSAQKLLFDALYDSDDPKVCLNEAINFAQQVSRTVHLSDKFSKTKISPFYQQISVTGSANIKYQLNEAGDNCAEIPASPDNFAVAKVNQPGSYPHFHHIQSAVLASNEQLIDGLNDAKRKIRSLKSGLPASKINGFAALAESITCAEKDSIYSSKKRDLEHSLKLLESQHKQFMLNFFSELNKIS